MLSLTVQWLNFVLMGGLRAATQVLRTFGKPNLPRHTLPSSPGSVGEKVLIILYLGHGPKAEVNLTLGL